jgi:Tfp pilus assembly protein PilE
MAAKTSRSRAFFLELVLDIAIFALCAAVALQVFVESRMVSERSSALTHLSLQTQQIAEVFKATGNIGANDLYFDKDFVACEKEDARYWISCAVTDGENRVKVAHISAERATAASATAGNSVGEELFYINVYYYDSKDAGTASPSAGASSGAPETGKGEVSS